MPKSSTIYSGLSRPIQQVQILKMPLLSAKGYYTRMGGQHCPLRTYIVSQRLFKGEEILWRYKPPFILMKGLMWHGKSAVLGARSAARAFGWTDLGTQQDQIIPPLQRSIGLLPDPQENTCKCVKYIHHQI